MLIIFVVEQVVALYVCTKAFVYLVTDACIKVVLVAYSSACPALCVDCEIVAHTHCEILNDPCLGIGINGKFGLHYKQVVVVAVPEIISCGGRQLHPAAQVAAQLQVGIGMVCVVLPEVRKHEPVFQWLQCLQQVVLCVGISGIELH